MEGKKFAIAVMIFLVLVVLLKDSCAAATGIGSTNDFSINGKEITTVVKEEKFEKEYIVLRNKLSSNQFISVEITGNITPLIQITPGNITLGALSEQSFEVTVYGKNSTGIYDGIITINGLSSFKIPVLVKIMNAGFEPINALMIEIELLQERIYRGRSLTYNIEFDKLLNDLNFTANVTTGVYPYQENKTPEKIFVVETKTYDMKNSFSVPKVLEVPRNFELGKYVMKVEARYLGFNSTATTTFQVRELFYNILFLGLELYKWFLILTGIGIGVFGYFWIKKYRESKKRFHVKVEYDLLPKEGTRSIFVGKIA
ncbi:hypothetical protein JXA85_01440, partial [Candidatus Woesearchaeota archaeon]|nr:hypothetical protein [Candidatus Woesearchaeota archaeon]